MGIKNKNILQWGIVFLVCAIAVTYIRLYPLRSHMYSSSSEQATLFVVMKVKDAIRRQIIQKFPTMPPAAQNRLIEEQFSQLIHQENSKVRKTIENVTESFAQKNPQTKQPLYLLESDPYYYYSLTANVLKTGRIAKTIRGSKYFDPMMTAPFGYWQPMTLHPYFGALIYTVLHFFNSSISLMSAVSFVPLIVTVLALLAFLWVCRIISCGPWAALSGAMFFALSPVFLRRSSLGWYDTDPYNLLFPLLLLAIFIKGMHARDNRQRIALYGTLYAITTTVYTLFWHGWVFMFIMHLIAGFIILFFDYLLKTEKNKAKNSAILLSTMVLGSFAGISLVFGSKDFFELFKEAWGELMKFTVHQMSLWPDLFLSVGELKKSSFHDILENTGGWFLMAGSLLGLLWSLVLSLKNFAHARATAFIIISLLFAAIFVLTLKADRFSVFLIIPMSLFFTLCVEYIFALVPKRLIVPPSAIKGIVAIALAASAFQGAQNNIKIVLTPIFNTAWEQALVAIKNQTPPQSIVNTWWSPGHFIKAIAERRVSFDGATLNQPAIGYWMSNMFLSTDENEARGILRMINISGNQAVEYLTGLGFKLSDAVGLVHSIVPKTKTQAEIFLKPFLNPTRMDGLIKLTHGQAPETYVLLYNELVDANILLKFTGRWNFRLIEQINNNPQWLKALPPRGSPDYIAYLWNTVGGAPKYSEALTTLGQEDEKLLFQQNITIDLKTMRVRIDSNKYGHGVPHSIFYLKDGNIKEEPLAGANLNYSVILYKEDSQYICRLMDPELGASLIMKLYYFKGQGLKYFHPLTTASDLTGRTKISVFKVDVNAAN